MLVHEFTGDSEVQQGANRLLQMLPEELGIDITDVDVRIVRETKQRCVYCMSL